MFTVNSSKKANEKDKAHHVADVDWKICCFQFDPMMKMRQICQAFIVPQLALGDDSKQAKFYVRGGVRVWLSYWRKFKKISYTYS